LKRKKAAKQTIQGHQDRHFGTAVRALGDTDPQHTCVEHIAHNISCLAMRLSFPNVKGMDKDLPVNTADGTADRGRPSDHLSQLSFGISTSLYQLKYTHFLLKRKKAAKQTIQGHQDRHFGTAVRALGDTDPKHTCVEHIAHNISCLAMRLSFPNVRCKDEDLPVNTADDTADRGRPSEDLSQLSFGISTSPCTQLSQNQRRHHSQTHLMPCAS